MMALHKFRLKRLFFPIATVLLFCAITKYSKGSHTQRIQIYSTLTQDTLKPKKDTVKPKQADTLLQSRGMTRLFDSANVLVRNDTAVIKKDITPELQADTFSLKLSKDTLDGPVNYKAEDSAVILVPDKKLILYSQTKTTYNDVTLTAPSIELNQKTNVLSAYSDRDSLGEVLTRARFEEKENKFESDTIQYNFKSQRGLTRNTYTKQDEMYVMGESIKKVSENTLFVGRGKFTTCNLDHPHFAFVANKLKVINSKVAVSGPMHPEFEDVPVPIYLPFGYYPLSKGRHSGFLPPQFTANEAFGLGLEGLGYYHVVNDYIDLTLRGNLYSYGGWTANLIPSYRKRYRYNGSMSLNLQNTKENFKGDPDFQNPRSFNIAWNHSADQRARPGTTFSALVNAGSTRYNENIPNNANLNFRNQLYSSISYSKSWVGKPYNLTLNANHDQNNATRLINVRLPDAGFTVTTLYPLQSKEQIGTPKWYEKIGIGYNGTFNNQISFYDTVEDLSIKKLLDTIRWGAQHRIPISLSLPPLGPLIVSPFVSYEERWLAQRYGYTWNNSKYKVDTVVRKGFYTDRQMSFGIGVNTALYGTAQFRKSRLVALRHVMRPTFSFNYKPDLSKKFYHQVQLDTPGVFARVPDFGGFGYGEGKFGGIGFGIDNNLEMKWRSRKDTGENAIKKIRLIDGFGFNSSYNFLADSTQLPLGDFNFYLRSTLFDKLNLNASFTVTPYQTDRYGRRIRKFVWQEGLFRPGRVTNGSLSLSTDFKSKPRDPEKEPETTVASRVQITDPTLMGDQQRLLDYMRRNPAEFVDFNIPWSVHVDMSIYFNNVMQEDGDYKLDWTSSLNFNNSFSLTPKWNFSTNGYFDLDTKKLQTFTMSINREMHCWQMSIGITPVGPQSYFNITISPKSSILQDLKVNRSRSFINY